MTSRLRLALEGNAPGAPGLEFCSSAVPAIAPLPLRLDASTLASNGRPRGVRGLVGWRALAWAQWPPSDPACSGKYLRPHRSDVLAIRRRGVAEVGQPPCREMIPLMSPVCVIDRPCQRRFAISAVLRLQPCLDSVPAGQIDWGVSRLATPGNGGFRTLHAAVEASLRPSR